MKLGALLETNDAWAEQRRKEEEERTRWFNRKFAAEHVINALHKLDIEIKADFQNGYLISPSGKKYHFNNDPKFLKMAYDNNGYRNIDVESRPEIIQYVMPHLGINSKNWEKFRKVHPSYGPYFDDDDFKREKLLRTLGLTELNTSLEKFKNTLKNFDYTYEMSDDHRVWTQGTNAKQNFKEMYFDLSDEDKLKAFEYWKSISNEFGNNMQQFIPPSSNFKRFASWFGNKTM